MFYAESGAFRMTGACLVSIRDRRGELRVGEDNDRRRSANNRQN